MERIYNKLVRDNIPEIIKSNGELPITRKLTKQEYKIALENKLEEECKEVIGASGKERVEELADVLEILRALAKLEGATLEDVIKVSDQKSAKRGAFEKRIYLEKVVAKEEN